MSTTRMQVISSICFVLSFTGLFVGLWQTGERGSPSLDAAILLGLGLGGFAVLIATPLEREP